MAGRARLSSARRAAIDDVRRRAEDRRALPPAVAEALEALLILFKKRLHPSRSLLYSAVRFPVGNRGLSNH